jgi:hypothetical protein
MSDDYNPHDKCELKLRIFGTSMCSKEAAIYVPPVAQVRIPNESKSPNQL